VDNVSEARQRGISHTMMRDVRCKDCLREVAGHEESAANGCFEYNETWAQRLVDRGGSRTDRCPRHRKLHRQAIQSMAVAYIDLQTIGEIADRTKPTGPLGGLGELPDKHEPVRQEADLAPYQFGMTDLDMLEILELLRDRRVLILKAGTGTGKSTFAPFRLLNPPDGAAIKITDFGPIVVTEPRVQATIGVARFVGEKLVRDCAWRECSLHGWFEDEHAGPVDVRCVVSDCARHIGPGFPVGYQVKGDKNHDDSCQLIYATDGTVINWLREGRLSKIGAIIVDEAHERSSNIDFILGFLKRELDRYPHLRVIVTSATFNVDFYVGYFGGPDKVARKEVPSVKSYGYGAPLFPVTEDGELPCNCDERAAHETQGLQQWLTTHWPERSGPVLEDGYREDLWATTLRLHELRFDRVLPPDDWRLDMPDALAKFVVRLVQELDRNEIHGDVLAFLATEKTIMPVVEWIKKELASSEADVYPLLATAESSLKEAALAARSRGARRRIVISTNIAETSLTVQGVRFVVDSGLICQEEWNPALATRDLPTKPHSQAGLQQRWGRVGRDGPGWVFPLYSHEQFASLARETPPGSTRTNLEQLVMKAKAGGVDDALDFPWPAAYMAPSVELDESAQHAVSTFRAEIARSVRAASANGILDADGDLTHYGKELERFSGYGSAAFAVAVMYADQLACLPEVVTALALMEDRQLLGMPKGSGRYLLPESNRWPAEWRVSAHVAHTALYEGCRDDLDLVLRVVGAWERADRDRLPWQDSVGRREWASGWWVEHELILRATDQRREVLGLLSPRMKEESKRLLEPRLFMRARAVLSRALQSLEYRLQEEGDYVLVGDPALSPVTIDRGSRSLCRASRVIALRRRTDRDGNGTMQSLIEVLPWAADEAPDPLELAGRCALHCAPRNLPDGAIDALVDFLAVWPTGGRYLAQFEEQADRKRIIQVTDYRSPFGYTAPKADGDTDPLDDDESLDDVDAIGEPMSLAAESSIAAEEATEASVRWPGGSENPEEDEEAVERLTVLDPEDSVNALEVNDDDELAALTQLPPPIDALATWREKAARTQLDRPLMTIDSSLGSGSWLVCTGYEVSNDGQISVSFASDWLAPDVTGDPSMHADLEFGAEVAVSVGPMISDGRSRYRVFYRQDRRGRFLTPERPDWRRGDPPIALDGRDTEFLGQLIEGAPLSATVVPGPSNTKTISLLPALSRHVEGAARQQHLPPGGRTNRRMPFWPAIVTEEAVDGRWARVELVHRDISSGLRHSFGVYPQTPGIDDVVITAGTEVLVQLDFGPQATLRGRPGRLAEVAERHDKQVILIGRSEGGNGAERELRSRRQLPRAVLASLLAGTTAPAWRLLSWNFYLSSHQRRIRGILSNKSGARMQHQIPVDAYQVDTKRYEIEITLPDYWVNAFTRHKAYLERLIGSPLQINRRSATARLGGRSEADRAAATLATILNTPAASVAVPQNKKGRVIGSGGEFIKTLQQVSGVWDCQFRGDTPELVVIAQTPDIILYVISEVAAVCANVRATMAVPVASASGLLIGKGGENIRRLRQQSGCAAADTTKGETIWRLRAPTQKAIYRFVELASELAPGCVLVETTIDEPPMPVRDLATDTDVTSWQTYPFSPAERKVCRVRGADN
jgi:HrpA-like RNA helicase